MTTAPIDQLQRILDARHHDPFEVLGAHPVVLDGQPAVAVRTFRPEAHAVHVVESATGERHEMAALGQGLFEAVLPREMPLEYRLELALYDGQRRIEEDPYRFLPSLSELELQLFGEGNLHRAYDSLGAQFLSHQGVEGVRFAVWAPGARRVSVIGDFNGWDGRRHAMRRFPSGVWELFIPHLQQGETYKYQLLTPHLHTVEKADPFAFATELRPRTGSILWDLRQYEWQDSEWMARRPSRRWPEEAVNVYEVYLPAWFRSDEAPDQYPTYREVATRLAAYVTEMGYTHIELMPITEYPYDGSWGYQVTGYFAPTSRMGSPDDFMFFVDTMHQHGIGVLIDWVPAHFPKDSHALARFDGTALYEHADPRQGEHKDWGTLIFNYGRNEVRNFLLASALFWMDHYHIDGLRVDAVASMLYLDYSRNAQDWLPNRFGGRENLEAIEFLRQLNSLTHHYYPGILTVAEESTSFPGVTHPVYAGGLGFDYKWNMGWMNDTLKYIALDPVFRKYEHNKLTFGLMYAFSEQFMLPISHDEVVHLKKSLVGKMPGDLWNQMASYRTYLGFMLTYPAKKLLFQGQDIAQWREFSEDRSTDWFLLGEPTHLAAQRWVRDLLHAVRDEPALHEVDHSWDGFKWVDVNDWEQSVISYLRFARQRDDFLVVIHNFTPIVRHDYRIGVPALVRYQELLNSDATDYGGSGVGNYGEVWAEALPWAEQPYSACLTLPPHATLILKPTSDAVVSDGPAAADEPGWVRNLHLQGQAPDELPPPEEERPSETAEPPAPPPAGKQRGGPIPKRRE